MKFSAHHQAPESATSDCLILGVYEDQKLTTSAQQVDQITGGVITDIMTTGDIKGRTEECLILRQLPNLSNQRVLLVGCGKIDELNENSFHYLSM